MDEYRTSVIDLRGEAAAEQSVTDRILVESVADRIALGDLAIRKRFAGTTLLLFVITNVFVLSGLGVLFWQDTVQLTAGRIGAGDRIVSAQVVMTLLGATTVQLGAVIYTMARAIFPATTPAG